MADRNQLQQMASASYSQNPPQTIGAFNLISQTPTLKFYQSGNNIVVAIRGTQPTDTNDLTADGLIGLNKLSTSSRYQSDLSTLREFQTVYPSPPYSYIGVGHSLGGAILDEFLRAGLLSSGLSYNPAVQPMDFESNLPNQRIYMSTDPLYKLMGQHVRGVEVRQPQGQSIWSRFLRKVPVLSTLYDKYNAHQLSNFVGGFVGGTHREDWLRKNKLDPSKRYSIAQLSKVSKVPKDILQEVYNRGIGAYKTNNQSVRLKNSYVKNVKASPKHKLSKEQWAWARLYSFLDGNPKHDNDLRENRGKVGGKKASMAQSTPTTQGDLLRQRINDIGAEMYDRVDEMANNNETLDPYWQGRYQYYKEHKLPLDTILQDFGAFIFNNNEAEAFPIMYYLYYHANWQEIRSRLDAVAQELGTNLDMSPHPAVDMTGHYFGSGVEDAVGSDDYFGSAEYLKKARATAKKNGYNPKDITYANDKKHKLQITTPDGKVVKFGKYNMGDFIIYSHLERKKKVPSGTADMKRNVFHKSHTKMKGNWKSNKFSKNNLALYVLW